MKAGIDFIGVSVGAMLINKEGKLFLSKRSKNVRNEGGRWEVPGGAVEFGEKLEDAIKREMREELDIDIKLLYQLPAANHIIPANHQHWVPTTFLSKIKGNKQPRIVEPEKCDEIGWFSFDHLPSPLSIITKIDIAWYRRNSRI